MDHSQYADIEVRLDWASGLVTHRERHYFQGINFWRDYFPGGLGESLAAANDGEWVSEIFPAG